jgi:hypothetical protein
VAEECLLLREELQLAAVELGHQELTALAGTDPQILVVVVVELGLPTVVAQAVPVLLSFAMPILMQT